MRGVSLPLSVEHSVASESRDDALSRRRCSIFAVFDLVHGDPSKGTQFVAAFLPNIGEGVTMYLIISNDNNVTVYGTLTSPLLASVSHSHWSSLRIQSSE